MNGLNHPRTLLACFQSRVSFRAPCVCFSIFFVLTMPSFYLSISSLFFFSFLLPDPLHSHFTIFDANLDINITLSNLLHLFSINHLVHSFQTYFFRIYYTPIPVLFRRNSFYSLSARTLILSSIHLAFPFLGFDPHYVAIRTSQPMHAPPRYFRYLT